MGWPCCWGFWNIYFYFRKEILAVKQKNNHIWSSLSLDSLVIVIIVAIVSEDFFLDGLSLIFIEILIFIFIGCLWCFYRRFVNKFKLAMADNYFKSYPIVPCCWFLCLTSLDPFPRLFWSPLKSPDSSSPRLSVKSIFFESSPTFPVFMLSPKLLSFSCSIVI